MAEAYTLDEYLRDLRTLFGTASVDIEIKAKEYQDLLRSKVDALDLATSALVDKVTLSGLDEETAQGLLLGELNKMNKLLESLSTKFK